MNTFVIFVLVFFISFLFTYLVRKFAIHKSILDIPNQRSSHRTPTPRGGGVAIILTWYLGLFFLFFNKTISNELFFALLSGIPIVIISFIDDIRSLPAIIRFIVQIVSVSFAVCIINKFDIRLLIYDRLFINLITIFSTVWFINLYNFLDGIDGYAATETIFVLFGFYLFIGDSLLLILLFSTLGFLFWNWQKAKIFMGDVGSTALGYNMAILAIYFINIGAIGIIQVLILTSLFWFDATVTLIRRIIKHENFLEPHKKHAYQRIVQYGYSHQKVVLISLIINIGLLSLAYLSSVFNKGKFFFLLIMFLVLYIILKLIDHKKPFK